LVEGQGQDYEAKEKEAPLVFRCPTEKSEPREGRGPAMLKRATLLEDNRQIIAGRCALDHLRQKASRRATKITDNI